MGRHRLIYLLNTRQRRWQSKLDRIHWFFQTGLARSRAELFMISAIQRIVFTLIHCISVLVFQPIGSRRLVSLKRAFQYTKGGDRERAMTIAYGVDAVGIVLAIDGAARVATPDWACWQPQAHSDRCLRALTARLWGGSAFCRMTRAFGDDLAECLSCSARHAGAGCPLFHPTGPTGCADALESSPEAVGKSLSWDRGGELAVQQQ